MKRIVAFKFLFLFVFSCVTQRVNTNDNVDYSKGIPYIFPGEVQKLLSEKIKDVKEPIYFLFDELESHKYKISINHYDPNLFKGTKWIKNTNRYIYLNGQLYPLIFEYDQLFSTTKTAKEFLESIEPDGSYTYSSIHVINEYRYYIEFNSKGEILYEGYGSLLKEK